MIRAKNPADEYLRLLFKLSSDPGNERLTGKLMEAAIAAKQADPMTSPEAFAWHARRLAEAAAYLAALLFRARGDARSAYVLDTVSTDFEVADAAATLPRYFAPIVEGAKPGAFCRIGYAGESADGRPRVSVWGDLRPWADYAPLSKDLAAAVCCFELFNGLAMLDGFQPRFMLEYSDGFAFRPVRSAGALAPIAEAVARGRVDPCPHCGRPVFKGRANSTAFCKKSFQIAYRKAALTRIQAGEGAECVIADFPYIKPETIREWERDPGNFTV